MIPWHGKWHEKLEYLFAKSEMLLIVHLATRTTATGDHAALITLIYLDEVAVLSAESRLQEVLCAQWLWPTPQNVEVLVNYCEKP